MMEATRQSSQPATVDLVRADLAEMWTIDHFHPGSPKIPAFSFDASDLDLEPVQTPRLRPSKSNKKDPLIDMLAGVLDPTPKRTGEKNNRNVAGRFDSGSFEVPNDENTSHWECARSDDFQPSRDTGIPFDPATRAGKPAELTSPQEIRVPGRSSLSKLSEPNTRAGDHPNKKTAITALPVHLAVPNPHRQPKSDNKLVASSTTGHGRETRSQRTRLPQKAVNSVSDRVKTKARKRDDDIFELSDSTDLEAGSGPKKRQAKVSNTLQSRGPDPRVGDSKANLPNRSRKSLRLPKKPAGLPLLGELEVEIQQRICEVPVDVGQKHETLVGPLGHHKDLTTSEGWQMDLPALPSHSTNTTTESALPDPPKSPPNPPRETEPLTLKPPASEDIIILSSDSENAGDEAPRSTSPLFLEQDQEYRTSSDGSDLPTAIRPGSSSDSRWPVGDSTKLIPSSSFTSPASFQPRSLPNVVGMWENHEIKRPMSTGNGHGNFLNEQPGSVFVSPDPAHGLEHSSGDDRLDPQDMWKQAVEDDSPPAVLHRIVTLLHRSLKPRGEVVRDIADDYKKNALRFLETLSARHIQEKAEALTAVRKASGTAFCLFSDAWHDMRIISGRLREMDATDTETILRRPGLTQKLDVVARLCQTRLSSTVQSGRFRELEPLENDSASEPEIVKGKVDSLVDTYQLKLCGAARQQNDQALEAYNKMDSEVDKFITQCIQGKSSNVPRPEIKKADTSKKTADEALEAFLDRIIDHMQDGDGRSSGQAAYDRNDHVVEVVADIVGMSDIEMND